MHAAIAAQPDRLWDPAIDVDSELAGHAGVLELTAQLLSISPRALVDYPAGMQIIEVPDRLDEAGRAAGVYSLCTEAGSETESGDAGTSEAS